MRLTCSKSTMGTLLFLGFNLLSMPIFAQTYSVGIIDGWVPWTTAYIAQEKGFWQEEGFTVEVKQFRNYDTELLKAFQHEAVDFAAVMIGSAVNLILQSPQYTIIYEHDWSHGGDLFIVSNSIDNVNTLKGQKISVYSNALSVTFFLQKILQTADLKLKDIQLIQNANLRVLTQGLKAGAFPAIITYGIEGTIPTKEGFGKVLFTSADFPGVIPEGVVVQRKILQDSPEDARKFMRGWLKAVQWQSNPANETEFFTILNRTFFKGTPYSDEEIRETMKDGKIHSTLSDIKEQNTTALNQFLQEFLTFTTETGVDVKTFNIADYAQTGIALEEAEKIFK